MTVSVPKPIIFESLNLMKFSWENGLSVELNRMNDNGKAEIWARYSPNGSPSTLIDVSELNMLAPRSRDEYCNRLKRLCPGLKEFDWTTAFAYIVPMALQARRQGDPVVELGLPGQKIKRPTWDAFPLVVSGMPNIIFGDRGSLKSKLVIVLGLIMMLPWEDNNLGIIAPQKSLNVLKLDFEATQDADDYEWHRILRGIDMEGALQLKYRACRRPLADDVEAISNHADNVKADVLIIDSLGPAAGGDLNASEPALRFSTAIRQLNRTTLIPAHTAKNPMTNRHTVFGNSFYENLARNIWEVTKEESDEDESTQVHIVLRQTKSPPFSSHHKPMAFEWDFDEEAERTTIQKYDASKLDSFFTHLSVGTKILDLLKSGSKNPKDIAEELGEKQDAIRANLFRLKKQGKVIKLGEGKEVPYGLPYKEP